MRQHEKEAERIIRGVLQQIDRLDEPRRHYRKEVLQRVGERLTAILIAKVEASTGLSREEITAECQANIDEEAVRLCELELRPA